MNIIEACKDERLFHPYFGNEYPTFRSWRYVLKAAYGLGGIGTKGADFLREVTGREQFNPDGYSQVLCLTGRRSGKSKGLAAVAGAYEAVLAGNEKKLSPGEIGMVAVLAPSKQQANIVKTYLRGIFDSSEVLRSQIVRETQSGFDLRNRVTISILAGDWKTVRGFTLLAAIVDELCFFGVDAESTVKSDSELIAALLPGLATTHGRLIGISSVYAKRGWAYEKWKRHFGNDKADDLLVVHAPSKTMNPTLDERIIKAAYEDDYAKASAEFGSQWRDDVALFCSREIIEKLVTPGLRQRRPDPRNKSYAFVDLSGGRSDASALAIAHRDPDGKVVLDFLADWLPPFNPQDVVQEMVAVLKQYRVTGVTGDNYAGEWVKSAFTARGMLYRKSPLNKSQLYLELMPKLSAAEIKLLDNERLVNQLSSLERRTRSGGRDIVDHPQGAGHHDDSANVVAGVAQASVHQRIKIGAF